MTSWEKDKIQIQAVSQLLWAIEKNAIPTIERMITILRQNNQVVELLKIDRFSSDRTLFNWITEVFPVPYEQRAGRPSQEGPSEELFEKVICIPNIFSDKGVCFPKLICVLKTLAQIAPLLNYHRREIQHKSVVVDVYLEPLPRYLRSFCLNTWGKTVS